MSRATSRAGRPCRTLRAFSLALCAFACSAHGGTEQSAAPLERWTWQQGALEREAFIHVPDEGDGAWPVVLALHGYNSTATGFELFHDLRRHAEDNGYLLVVPQGTHFSVERSDAAGRITSWNLFAEAKADPAAPPTCDGSGPRYPCPPECAACGPCDWAACHDDLAYFDRLLDELLARYPADPNRVYAVGMSNGAMMALRLGCDRSRRFAGIAAVGGQMPIGYGCRPSRPLPLLLLWGGQDDTVPPHGARSADGYRYESVSRSAAAWAEALACEDAPAPWSNLSSEAGGLECRSWGDCGTRGLGVLSCGDPDETHNWPGRRPGGPWPTCVTPQQREVMPERPLCAARTGSGPHRGMDLVWSFFQPHRRPTTGN